MSFVATVMKSVPVISGLVFMSSFLSAPSKARFHIHALTRAKRPGYVRPPIQRQGREGSGMRKFIAAACIAVALTASGAAPAMAGERYVALGDSYSSGTGTRTYFDSTCQRSVYAYPYLVAQDRPNTSLVFAACSGAKTGDVLANQVQQLTTGTRFVSITVGGNDAGFSSVITECAKPAWASDCAGRVSTAQTYIRNTLPGQLNNVYA